VAIKILPPHLVHDPRFVKRFHHEAQVAASLRHPGIIPIHAIERDGDCHFLVMDYADGGTLREYLDAQATIPWSAALDIIDQIAAALDYAHSKGIVHRDVKPSNILMTQDGHVILSDFGIARAAEHTRLTLTGGQLGTPEYMAPEQALGDQVGPATDVYALGILAYEMAAGRTPFKAETALAVLHKQVYETPPPLRGLDGRLPLSAQRAILRALEKAPAARFPTAGAFAQALRHDPVTSRPRRPSHSGPNIAQWLWLFLALTVVLVVIVLVTALPSQAPEEPNVAIPAASPAPSSSPDRSPTPSPTAPALPPTAEPAPTHTPVPPPPTQQPTATIPPSPSSGSRDDITDVIYRYRELKAIAIGRSHDVSQLPMILRGEALKELTNAVKWQRDNGAYYDTTWHSLHIDFVQQKDETHAEALVTKVETLLYYPRGWATPSAKVSCIDCEYQAYYWLERIGGRWYIVDKDQYE